MRDNITSSERCWGKDVVGWCIKSVKLGGITKPPDCLGWKLAMKNILVHKPQLSQCIGSIAKFSYDDGADFDTPIPPRAPESPLYYNVLRLCSYPPIPPIVTVTNFSNDPIVTVGFFTKLFSLQWLTNGTVFEKKYIFPQKREFFESSDIFEHSNFWAIWGSDFSALLGARVFELGKILEPSHKNFEKQNKTLVYTDVTQKIKIPF